MDFLTKWGPTAATVGAFLAGLVFAVLDLMGKMPTAAQKTDIGVICGGVVIGFIVISNLIQEIRHNQKPTGGK